MVGEPIRCDKYGHTSQPKGSGASQRGGAKVNINADFKRGFMVAVGVLAAMYFVGIASGVVKRII
jgi:hypothetical protein